MNTERDTDSYEMTLAYFDYQAPCILQLADPSCDQPARFIAIFRHLVETDECERPPRLPVCVEHRRMLALNSNPFWSMWFQQSAPPCEFCGKALQLERFDPITGGGA
ncbi:hypothetical protein [Streptomyces griseus]|uniref:hypothetical protein n=1 Tax=Streptomyces griseus TaxID=1911 RepID=UPI0033BFE5E9